MFEKLRKLWKCSADQAEHTIRTNENHARLVVSRRSFFSASAVALAAPTTLISHPYREKLVELVERPLVFGTVAVKGEMLRYDLSSHYPLIISTTLAYSAYMQSKSNEWRKL